MQTRSVNVEYMSDMRLTSIANSVEKRLKEAPLKPFTYDETRAMIKARLIPFTAH